MKRWVSIATVAGLLALSACGQNPLLKSVSADLAPVRLNSQWSFVDKNGVFVMGREVTSAGTVQGREGFTITTTYASGPNGSEWWSFNNGSIEKFDASLGWILARRLPYVFSNKWTLAQSNALVTAVQSVEGLETVATPAGKFESCYRLKTKTSTYDAVNAVTNTVESLAWAAPNVGDVRYADVDVAGNITITMALSSYRITR